MVQGSIVEYGYIQTRIDELGPIGECIQEICMFQPGTVERAVRNIHMFPVYDLYFFLSLQYTIIYKASSRPNIIEIRADKSGFFHVRTIQSGI